MKQRLILALNGAGVHFLAHLINPAEIVYSKENNEYTRTWNDQDRYSVSISHFFFDNYKEQENFRTIDSGIEVIERRYQKRFHEVYVVYTDPEMKEYCLTLQTIKNKCNPQWFDRMHDFIHLDNYDFEDARVIMLDYRKIFFELECGGISWLEKNNGKIQSYHNRNLKLLERSKWPCAKRLFEKFKHTKHI